MFDASRAQAYGGGGGGYGEAAPGFAGSYRGRGNGGDRGGGGFRGRGGTNAYADGGFRGDGRCRFFSKCGACRHGERCGDLHYQPEATPTLHMPMMYPNPLAVQHLTDDAGRPRNISYDPKYLQKHVDKFVADLWVLLLEFGPIVDIKVCDNLCDHLLGSVYVKFESPSYAQAALDGLKQKKYNGIILMPEKSPVYEFDDARCKEHDGQPGIPDTGRPGVCGRGTSCNFLHLKNISGIVLEKLRRLQDKKRKKFEPKDCAVDDIPELGRPGTNSRPADHDRHRSDRHRSDRDRERRKRSRSPTDRRHRDDRSDRSRRHHRSHRDRSPRSDGGRRHHRSDRDRDDRRDRDRGGEREYHRHRDGRIEEKKSCHMCGQPGHLGKDCPLKSMQ